MREVADQNTTLANLGLGPIKSKAVRKAERTAAKAARDDERAQRLLEAQPVIPGGQPRLTFRMAESSATADCGSSRPSLTGKTAHALNQRMRSQPDAGRA